MNFKSKLKRKGKNQLFFYVLFFCRKSELIEVKGDWFICHESISFMLGVFLVFFFHLFAKTIFFFNFWGKFLVSILWPLFISLLGFLFIVFNFISFGISGQFYGQKLETLPSDILYSLLFVCLFLTKLLYIGVTLMNPIFSTIKKNQ